MRSLRIQSKTLRLLMPRFHINDLVTDATAPNATLAFLNEIFVRGGDFRLLRDRVRSRHAPKNHGKKPKKGMVTDRSHCTCGVILR
jgi:hypothetical protein